MSLHAQSGEPAEKDGIPNQLIARLKELISNGMLVPGAKLPPERELAAAFGVSRSSLRHALKALEIMGVLTQRVGDGTYLTSNSKGVLRQPLELLMLMDGISLDDVLETRLIVEPELAAQAAERATLEDLKRMLESLEVMEREKHEAKLIEADLAFHEAIFLAARNPICTRIFSLLHRAMITSIELTSQLVDWKHTLSFHRPIYVAIERRCPAEARAKMIEHLSDARLLLAKIKAQTRNPDVTTAIEPLTRKTRGVQTTVADKPRGEKSGGRRG